MSYLILQSPLMDSQRREQAAAIAEADQVIQVRNHVVRFNGFNPEQLGELSDWAQQHRTDMAVLETIAPLSDLKLLAMDMDSTLINIECIDEIAEAAGKGTEVAAITEASMRGEIKDFTESLRRRVAMLEGVDATYLEHVYEHRLQLNPGAEHLLTTAKHHGITTLLVSGGFTFFTQRLKARLGIDHAYANELEVKAGKLTGRVLGDIVDGAAKARYLRELAQQLGAGPMQCMAIGDGANDLPMMSEVHYSVAYHAKPAVQAAARFSINYNGLDAVLHWFDKPNP